MAQAREGVVVLQSVRLSFPKLFKPEASIEGGTPKFGAAFLMDPETETGKANIKALKAAIGAVAKKTWAEKAEKVMKALDSDRSGLRDGDTATNGEGDVYSGYENMVFVSASNRKRPQVLNRDKTPITEEDNVIYGGCYVDAVVSVWATADKKLGGNGVFCTLEVVRFRKDGEAFGAAPVDADDYLDDLDDDDDDMI
jgi:hypothetical protein